MECSVMVTKYLPQPQVFWRDLDGDSLRLFLLVHRYMRNSTALWEIPKLGDLTLLDLIFLGILFFFSGTRTNLCLRRFSICLLITAEVWDFGSLGSEKIFLYDRSVKQAGCHVLLLQYALVQHEHDNTGHSLKQMNGQSCCLLTVALIFGKIPPSYQDPEGERNCADN